MSGSSAWWRPDRFARKRAGLEARARAIAAVRAFFAGAGLVEVDTPALQISPGLEPHLMAFATDIDDPLSGASHRLFLHTSPEFAMKKLLVAGMPAIYQLSHVFRNAERGPLHHPEFTMLEWYRGRGTTADLMADCEGLLRAVAQAVAPGERRGFAWRDRRADPFADWERLTVADAFARETGIDILATARDPHAPDIADLAPEARRIGVRVAEGDRWDDLFFRIFLERIEPTLGVGRPTLLTGYPISMAALARPDPNDPRLADRFELYVAGLELANAFGELTDAVEQRRRFEADMDLKQALYGIRYPIDEGFLAALEHGLPASAGIALGIDRLVMLAVGADHIEDILWAPVEVASP